MSTEPQTAPVPEGWTFRKEWFGYRFTCDFHAADDDERTFSVEALVYTATGEMRIDGPRRTNTPRDSAQPAPVWAVDHANRQVRRLLDALCSAPAEAQAEPPHDTESVVA